jgi:hypothetical protein
LPGLLREKIKYIWVPFLDPEVIKILSPSEAEASLGHTYLGSFFLDPEDIRKLSIGAIWKEQGSFHLVQNMEHKGPVLRPRCIGTVGARTQIPFSSTQQRLYVQDHHTTRTFMRTCYVLAIERICVFSINLGTNRTHLPLQH